MMNDQDPDEPGDDLQGDIEAAYERIFNAPEPERPPTSEDAYEKNFGKPEPETDPVRVAYDKNFTEDAADLTARLEAGDPKPEAAQDDQADVPDKAAEREAEREAMEREYDRIHGLNNPPQDPQWLTETFAPHAEGLKERGLATPQEFVGTALAAHDHLVRDPVSGIGGLVQQYVQTEQQLEQVIFGLRSMAGYLGEPARADFHLKVEMERLRPDVTRFAEANKVTPEEATAMADHVLLAIHRGEHMTKEQALARVRPQPTPQPAKAPPNGKASPARQPSVADDLRAAMAAPAKQRLGTVRI